MRKMPNSTSHAANPRHSNKAKPDLSSCVGAGRRELHRLMDLYKVKIPDVKPVDEEDDDDIPDMELKAAVRKRLVNVGRIEKIVVKAAWERRPEEVELVRKEISKMEVFRKIDVSPAAERDICKCAMLKKFPSGEVVVREGDIGDAFYIVLEGILKVQHSLLGHVNDLYASDTFGELAMVEENSVRKATVVVEHSAKLLEIRRAEYDRYIKPWHVEEQNRMEKLIKELKEFETWDQDKILGLKGAMHIQRYKMGDTIVQEGTYTTSLMFVVVGHVKVTKHVVDDRVKLRAQQLPSPLRGATANRSAQIMTENNVAIGILYRGSCIDPEAVLGRTRCNYTATAMSNVDIVYVETLTHIFVDNPVIDSDTLALIKRNNILLPDSQSLQTMFRDDLLWGLYKDHLASYVVYRKRKEQVAKAGPFSKFREVQRDDLLPDVALDNPPLHPQHAKGKRSLFSEPTDGRWPFLQPNIYRSEVVQKALAMTPIHVMMTDKTIV
eukprot:CAMPEP_0181291444 /NCGR_PEP_ID=MMETSP1101-20121128/1969_1 /TAXON_ID=46948 /ORGANISM="Rhodomonas abbreviata, Strain Caron Lab Isolate" /LENGTH=494 /DNA_ID=CAMNT_0023395833 /DNA_START=83 /DNA_END=1567 /DNA_ORIENTATION=-